METKYYCHCHIAGFTYYQGVLALEELKPGTSLQMQHEPDNKHDDNAVVLYYKDFKLGYVPRSHNAAIATLLCCGYTDIFEVYVQGVNPHEHPEKQVQVVVHLKAASQQQKT